MGVGQVKVTLIVVDPLFQGGMTCKQHGLEHGQRCSQAADQQSPGADPCEAKDHCAEFP